jgi:hypothetical protein
LSLLSTFLSDVLPLQNPVDDPRNYISASMNHPRTRISTYRHLRDLEVRGGQGDLCDVVSKRVREDNDDGLVLSQVELFGDFDCANDGRA